MRIFSLKIFLNPYLKREEHKDKEIELTITSPIVAVIN